MQTKQLPNPVPVAQTRLTDMLKETVLQPEDIQSLLRLRASVKPLDSTNLRIDLAPYTHVHWINDLEKVTTPPGSPVGSA